MTIYGLLRLIVRRLAKTGGLSSHEAFEAIDLIAKLERINALGTATRQQEGEDPRV